MKKSFNLLLLLLCFFHSMVQASSPSQSDFDFLEPINDTALVANGLEFTKSIAGVSLSTLLNLGIWWGVCKTAGIVSGLSITYDLAASDAKEPDKWKTDFCLQLAPVITTAEVALAGHVSPWPLEQHWWKPLYFAGAVMAAYTTNTKTRERIPVAVLTYLASEAVSRTGASAISAFMLRKMSIRDISTEWYAAGGYTILSLSNGLMAGDIAYEVMTHKGFRPAKVIFASAVSAAIVGTLLGIISELIIDEDRQIKAGVEAVTASGALTGIGAVTVIGTVAGFGAVTGIGVLNGIGALSGALSGVVSGAIAGAGLGAGVGVGILNEVGLGAGVAALAGVALLAPALGGVGALLMLGSSKISSNNPFIKAGVTLVPALTFAVVNGLSSHAVYGYPLEQSFSETGWTQWKKFYAPLNYLSTLFN
ncbi:MULTISPECIES: hypothetical protein [unclassified Endozoicomonas]|uniref:hypothetical protein n=1 Tax=unclassified Endozoicomonas TaxID=2644528 RepID=UPI0027D2921E|nr:MULTISPECIES: hypothetical protein [unclassified Endozoicomonas]